MEERHQKDVKEVSQLKILHEKKSFPPEYELTELSRVQNKINRNPLSAAEGSLHEDKIRTLEERISKCQSKFEAYDK